MKIRNGISILLLLVIILGCEKSSDSAMDSGTGKGGSLARFTIVGNHLYIADYAWIEVFDIQNPSNPVRKNRVNVGFPVETIFPYKEQLFIGSTDGMFIYSIKDPALPVKQGEARHVRSCDPVVANDKFSYVTLRGDSRCGPAQDGLYIYDISNIASPVQKSLLPLSRPMGLGLKDSVVFVCRESEGLTLVNVKDPAAPKTMYTIKEASYKDVIPYDDLLICYVSTGLLLYDIRNLSAIKQVGKIDN